MVVKETRGRRRYVAFDLGRKVPKEELEAMLRSSGYTQIRVVQCAGGWCILRCEPRLLKRIGGLMGSFDEGFISKSTSGNLLTLRRRYPILWDTRPRYIAFAVTAEKDAIETGLRELGDEDGPSLKLYVPGYAIVKCALRDSERTERMMSEIDNASASVSSSYKATDLRKLIAGRCPDYKEEIMRTK